MEKPFLSALAISSALLLPVGASAQLAAPGLGLNRPDLLDEFAGATPYYLGEPAVLKGAEPVTFTFGQRVGRIRGGVWPQTVSSLLNPASIFTGLTGNLLSDTLLPPFASGAAVRDAGSKGSFALASLFEPDQIKRSGKDGKSRLQLKQKNHVGIRFGNWSGASMTYNTYGNFGAVPGCKAQADFRWDANKGEGRRRFKLRCKGDDPGVGALADWLEAQLLLKPKAQFDLEQITGP